ncbi:MAG: SGNH/GDSL hydrolase family protein, partial [Clostridiales bacterium]
MNTNKIVIFGDSVMRGLYWDEESGSYKVWKNPFPHRIAENQGVEIINQAQVGHTIERGELTIEKALAKGLDCQIALLEYGGNDCDYNWAAIAENPHIEHQPNTPLPRFREIYQRIIAKLRQQQIIPVVMALPPIHSQRYYTWFSQSLNQENLLTWINDVNIIYRHQECYSLEAERIGLENDCP